MSQHNALVIITMVANSLCVVTSLYKVCLFSGNEIMKSCVPSDHAIKFVNYYFSGNYQFFDTEFSFLHLFNLSFDKCKVSVSRCSIFNKETHADDAITERLTIQYIRSATFPKYFLASYRCDVATKCYFVMHC